MTEKLYTWAEVSKNTGKNGNRCWIVVDDNVYDVTDGLSSHPGGADIILEQAGKDATKAFNDIGHSNDAKGFLKAAKIGELVEADKKKNRTRTEYSEPKQSRSCLSIITCGCMD